MHKDQEQTLEHKYSTSRLFFQFLPQYLHQLDAKYLLEYLHWKYSSKPQTIHLRKLKSVTKSLLIQGPRQLKF